MNLINGKNVLVVGINETINDMMSKTNLSKKVVSLLIESFILFLKKDLFENGKVSISGLGEFTLRSGVKRIGHYLYGFRRYKVIRVKFKPFRLLRDKIKGIKKFQQTNYKCRLSKEYEYFELISKLFGLSIKDAKYLFFMFFNCVGVYLKNLGAFRIPKFGNLYLTSKQSDKMLVSKQWGKDVVTIYTIRFKVNCVKELNCSVSQYYISSRLRRMLYLAGVSKEIIRIPLESMKKWRFV